eukprot:TRINITY_DN38645_c0_g1_i1.p1 TRINITY_DN38645_c0_g1~~TRINITY_DN38645_c0_g1_i1.p1  ORF type:complete len:177 (+),score=52.78 TRINITY_DN38645_c0_g1_i1:132-662(+)
MLRSLVGSEMCIRDSLSNYEESRAPRCELMESSEQSGWLATLRQMDFDSSIAEQAVQLCDTIEAAISFCCTSAAGQGAPSPNECLVEMGFDPAMVGIALDITDSQDEALEWLVAEKQIREDEQLAQQIREDEQEELKSLRKQEEQDQAMAQQLVEGRRTRMKRLLHPVTRGNVAQR